MNVHSLQKRCLFLVGGVLGIVGILIWSVVFSCTYFGIWIAYSAILLGLLLFLWKLLYKNVQLQHHLQQMEAALHENASAIRQSVIIRLIHDEPLTEQQISSAFADEQSNSKHPCVLMMIRFPYSAKLHGNFHENTRYQAQQHWLEFCKTRSNLRGEWFWIDQMTILGLLFLDNDADVDANEVLQIFGADIQGHESNNEYALPTVAFSQSQENLSQGLSLYYRQAEDLVNQKLHTNARAPYFYDPAARICPSFEVQKQQLLVHYIQSGRAQEATSLLNTYFSVLHANPVTQCSNVKKQCHHILSMVSSAIRDSQLPQDALQNIFQMTREALEQQTSVHGCAETILSLVQNVCAIVGNTRQNKSSAKIEKLTQWISENYQKDISLDDMASQIGCSASYTSKLFKSVTGVELVSYLNSVRIEHVKQLLHSTPLSVSEIAIHAGYNSPQTMIRNFKKITGLTPSEYRNRCSSCGPEKDTT